MIVAKMPAGFPSPKNRMPGSRYTKLGIVCIPSNMGRIRLFAILLRAASTPRGRPTVTAITTATTISAIVSTVFSHRSMKPTNSRANMVNPISLQRPTAKERKATATTTAGQGTNFNMSSIVTSA